MKTFIRFYFDIQMDETDGGRKKLDSTTSEKLTQFAAIKAADEYAMQAIINERYELITALRDSVKANRTNPAQALEDFCNLYLDKPYELPEKGRIDFKNLDYFNI